jgi:hypothetical protein
MGTCACVFVFVCLFVCVCEKREREREFWQEGKQEASPEQNLGHPFRCLDFFSGYDYGYESRNVIFVVEKDV